MGKDGGQVVWGCVNNDITTKPQSVRHLKCGCRSFQPLTHQQTNVSPDFLYFSLIIFNVSFIVSVHD